MLREFQKNLLCKESASVGLQLLGTLIELIQGPCRENQHQLMKLKIIDTCRDILRSFTSEEEYEAAGFSNEESEQIDEIKMSVVQLMVSSIEGHPDIELVRGVTLALDNFSVAFSRMKIVYERFVVEVMGMKKESTAQQVNSILFRGVFDSFVSEGFNLYILVNKLADTSPDAKKHLKEMVDSLKRMK